MKSKWRAERPGQRRARDDDAVYVYALWLYVSGLGAAGSSMPMLWLWTVTLPLEVEVEVCLSLGDEELGTCFVFSGFFLLTMQGKRHGRGRCRIRETWKEEGGREKLTCAVFSVLAVDDCRGARAGARAGAGYDGGGHAGARLVSLESWKAWEPGAWRAVEAEGFGSATGRDAARRCCVETRTEVPVIVFGGLWYMERGLSQDMSWCGESGCQGSLVGGPVRVGLVVEWSR